MTKTSKLAAEQLVQTITQLQLELEALPQQANILAVSKQQNAVTIAQAFQAGQTRFGENYLQEALGKMLHLKGYAIEWHFIGPIQSNKCKAIAEHFHWVQSIEQIKHAEKLNNYCPEGKILQICVQVNIDQEASKSGVLLEEVSNFCDALSALPKLQLRGLMAIPKATESLSEQRQSFAKLATCFKQLQTQNSHLDTLSMGMSGDYSIALEEGATMIRLGSKLFGERNK